MNVFSIRDIENLTGIKAHTLRIWEQRYSFLKPKRKESLHRAYDNNDLKHLLRITHLYHRGYKISKIASLDTNELKRLTLEAGSGQTMSDLFINRLTEATLDFDAPQFETQLGHAIQALGFDKTVTDVLFPLLHRIGKLWMVDTVSPAQEHFASAIVIRKLLSGINSVPVPFFRSGERKVLIFAPEKEYHEIPLLLMHYGLRKAGVSTCYVGKNASIETLLEYSDAQPITEIYFNVITYLLPVDCETYLRALSTTFPKIEIFCSGTGVPETIALPPNVRLLKTKQAMIAYIGGNSLAV